MSGRELPPENTSEKHSEANAHFPSGNEEQLEAHKPKQISSIEPAATKKEPKTEAYSTTPSGSGTTKPGQRTATGMQPDAKSKMKTTNGDEKGEELKSSKGMSDFTI